MGDEKSVMALSKVCILIRKLSSSYVISEFGLGVHGVGKLAHFHHDGKFLEMISVSENWRVTGSGGC